MSYRAFFGLKKQPFVADLDRDHILETPDLLATADRLAYATGLGAIALVTGDVGSGKSTALRWVTGRLHPSSHRVLWVTATSGSILEFYRQLLAELDINTASSSRAVLTRLIKAQITDLVRAKKLQPLLIVDEASLLRLDVFAELHTITQFEGDSKPWLPVVLAGQNNLADNLLYRTAIPLASRIVTRSHFQAVDRQTMEDYIAHHLKIAGLKHNPFEAAAITAIHQGAGGLFRKANNLARGALVAAASEKSQTITADHVRLAASELLH
ncbi:MAG: ExeA family protein [Chloroflexota bacterium]